MSQDCERHVAVRGRIEKSDHNRCSDSKKKMLSKLLGSLGLKRGPSTMEYYSSIKKNSFESVLMRWMKLEAIIE